MKKVFILLALFYMSLNSIHASFIVSPSEDHLEITQDNVFKIKIEAQLENQEDLDQIYNQIECTINGSQTLIKYIDIDDDIYCIRTCPFPVGETIIKVKYENTTIKKYTIGDRVGIIDTSAITYQSNGDNNLIAGEYSTVWIKLFDTYGHLIKGDLMDSYLDRIICYTDSKNMSKYTSPNDGNFLCTSEENTIAGSYVKTVKFIDEDQNIIPLVTKSYNVVASPDPDMTKSTIQFPLSTYSLQTVTVKATQLKDKYENTLYYPNNKYRVYIQHQSTTYDMGEKTLTSNGEYSMTMPYLPNRYILFKFCKGTSNCKQSSVVYNY